MPARVEEQLVVALAGFGGSIELRGGSRLSVPALHYVDESESRSLACWLLESLQEAVATGDVDAVMALFTDEPTLFGTAGTNLDEKAVRSYVEKMLAQGPFRWAWYDVVPQRVARDVLLIGATGDLLVGAGDALTATPIRATVVAVRRHRIWRLSHFHASSPV